MWTGSRSVEHTKTLVRERPSEESRPLYLLFDPRLDVQVDGISDERPLLVVLSRTDSGVLADDAASPARPRARGNDRK